MNQGVKPNPCDQSDVTCAFVLLSLPPGELSACKAHIAGCPHCRREVQSLRALIDRFVTWPTDVLRPTTSLHARLALRIAEGSGGLSVLSSEPDWREPDWDRVTSDIERKLLACDAEADRVSLLVRLAAGGRYRARTHAGIEELYLLDGELWIDGRKLQPGDYNLRASGTDGEVIWSETGCTYLLITDVRDALH